MQFVSFICISFAMFLQVPDFHCFQFVGLLRSLGKQRGQMLLHLRVFETWRYLKILEDTWRYLKILEDTWRYLKWVIEAVPPSPEMHCSFRVWSDQVQNNSQLPNLTSQLNNKALLSSYQTFESKPNAIGILGRGLLAKSFEQQRPQTEFWRWKLRCFCRLCEVYQSDLPHHLRSGGQVL